MTIYILETEERMCNGYSMTIEVGRAFTEEAAKSKAKILAGLGHCNVRIEKRTTEYIGTMKGSSYGK